MKDKDECEFYITIIRIVPSSTEHFCEYAINRSYAIRSHIVLMLQSGICGCKTKLLLQSYDNLKFIVNKYI